MQVSFDQASELAGELRLPGSKSYTHRALLVASLLCGGQIRHPLASADTRATREALSSLGARCELDSDSLLIKAPEEPSVLDNSVVAGESGTLLRFLIPIFSVLPGVDVVKLRGEGTLENRSHREVIENLHRNDLRVETPSNQAMTPVVCYPGQAPPDIVRLSAETTSQHVSGWLIALAARGGGQVVVDNPPVSAPYIEMTCRVLEAAGVKINRSNDLREFEVEAVDKKRLDYTVPGDYSSAAFHLVGVCLAGRSVRFRGLKPDDPQADRQIVSLLSELGAQLERDPGSEACLRASGPFRPGSFTYDAGATPDLVPVLSVLAAYSTGERVVLENISHLQNKESDRLEATRRELERAGVEVKTTGESLEICPNNEAPKLEAENFETYRDHRMAMALSIFGLVGGDCVIQGADCVDKSYPQFYEDLKELGAEFSKTSE